MMLNNLMLRGAVSLVNASHMVRERMARRVKEEDGGLDTIVVAVMFLVIAAVLAYLLWTLASPWITSWFSKQTNSISTGFNFTGTSLATP